MEPNVRCLFQPIPGEGDIEEGGKQISCYGGAPTDLIEQGDCLQAFLMSLVQLSCVYICSGQPCHHPEGHQVVPCLADPLLRRTQPSHQEGTVLLERQGQPEGEGERDQLPTHLLIRGQRFYLLRQETQALFVSTSHDGSDLDQGPQQEQTPPDQRHLCL